MVIKNSTHDDLQTIMDMYRNASTYMRSKNQIAWPEFDTEWIADEINNQQQWKLIIEGKIACIWMTAFEDPLIWGKNEQNPSLYLHRITTHTHFRGQGVSRHLFNWADRFAVRNQLSFIRMDTVGENDGLIQLYGIYGFSLVGMQDLTNEKSLPLHYREGPVCLFQKEVLGPRFRK